MKYARYQQNVTIKTGPTRRRSRPRITVPPYLFCKVKPRFLVVPVHLAAAEFAHPALDPTFEDDGLDSSLADLVKVVL